MDNEIYASEKEGILKVRSVGILLLAAASFVGFEACSATIPSGVFACTSASECPTGFSCVQGFCTDGATSGSGSGTGETGAESGNDPCELDGNEPNNGEEDITQLFVEGPEFEFEIDQVVSAGNIHSVEDVDWFSLIIESSPAELNVTLEDIPEGDKYHFAAGFACTGTSFCFEDAMCGEGCPVCENGNTLCEEEDDIAAAGCQQPEASSRRTSAQIRTNCVGSGVLVVGLGPGEIDGVIESSAGTKGSSCDNYSLTIQGE